MYVIAFKTKFSECFTFSLERVQSATDRFVVNYFLGIARSNNVELNVWNET